MSSLLQTSDYFKCPSCGADMKLDVSSKTACCDFCNRKDEITAVNEDIVDLDFNKTETDASLNDWGTDVSVVRCAGCGKQSLSASADAPCAFCGSADMTFVDMLPGLRPDSLIPFKIDVNKAVQLFIRWIKRRRFSPFALKREFKAGNIRGVYIPYWSYDTNAKSSYTGQAGDYYYDDETSTVTISGKTETKTRRIQKIRWRFVSGSYDRNFKDIMFNDSALDQKVLESLEPFRLNELIKYEPRFLQGFYVERQSGGLKAVWERARSYMGKAIRTDIQDTIRRGCDVLGKININTNFTDVKYRLMLLPVWISSYRFRSKTYNFYINGQTGEVQGKSPRSILKIGGIIVILAGIITGLCFLLKVF